MKVRLVDRKNDIVTNVAKQFNLPKKAVEEIYTLYFRFMREKIISYDLTHSYTDEEFKKQLRGFNMEHVGNFHINKFRLNNPEYYDRSKRD
jgi:hypothetical protein